MTHQTEQAFESARTQITIAQAKVDAEVTKVLTQIAEAFPEHADVIAKRYANEQPEVTRLLGKSGIEELRAGVSEEAKTVGASFVAAADEIDWPTNARVEPRQIHSALFARFYGKIDGIIRPIQRAGYRVDKPIGVGVVLPQQFYKETWFSELAMALSELATARSAYDTARSAHDAATVDDLWT